ncbi:DUF3182 family protein [Bradyrhizobium sp. AUGA SZCCT0160]|uniref:DUF3182 family protein n=1 Tax=Bradyrhizobium sp. AUGA SZCCT0160 TaxID=2807662 RepID=UPI001BA84039|nr:DUF3182 family protein [Bradyrhizobium sp. AUGA SZCCT0160]MBR1190099.1 DUF3182 family protein [Bradyrhizobium sp. AUGA SZCCT0160]
MANEFLGERTVVIHAPAGARFCTTHERLVHLEIAKRIAALKGGCFGGEFDHARAYRSQPYLVPTDTIIGIDQAHELGVFTEHDLFGGVVPHAFVGTKAITHGLIEENATAPTGWSHDFAKIVRDIVPRGYTAFSRDDAHLAAHRLLHDHPIRIKPVKATGGRGQLVVGNVGELDSAVEQVDQAQLTQFGLVLEENLGDPKTYSIGQVRLDELVASYHGTQNLVSNNSGRTAYGGSDLTVVRGELDSLMTLDGLSDGERLAIAQAQRYDAAAMRCFPGMIVSRRNYDVIEGTSATGRRCSGVLEQSWRIGGATPAEITALEVLRADPGLQTVRVSSVEAYGTSPAKPANAIVYFEGVDERLGPMIKYAHVKPA